MNKITKSQIKSFLKAKLSSDAKWAAAAMLRIYDHQTATEQDCRDTHLLNGVGFTGSDAYILSSFSEQYRNKGYLSPKQMSIVFKKVPKYWNQIYTISDKSKLDPMISEYTSSVKRMY